MKTMNVLLAFSVSLLMAACQSETMETDPQSLPKDAKLTVTLQGTALSRATGSSLPNDDDNGEKKLNRVAVGVFLNGGAVNVIKEFEAAAITSGIPQITCAAGTSQTIVVVANAPANAFAGVTTYNAFIAKTVSLSSAVVSTNLPISGQETNIDITAAGPNSKIITISRLVARVSLSSVKTQFEASGRYPAAKFKITDVFLYNAGSTSSVQPDATAFPTVTNLVGGLDNSGTATAYTWLTNTIAGTATGGTTLTENLPASTLYWFYAFANDASSKSTKLVIKGEWDEDGDGTKDADVYYPVIVNKIQPGTVVNDGTSDITTAADKKGDGKVYRNSTYKVSVIIKGRGSDNPDEDVTPAYLQVTVTVASWALNLTQEVVFE